MPQGERQERLLEEAARKPRRQKQARAASEAAA
jgi:hypothetical protein